MKNLLLFCVVFNATSLTFGQTTEEHISEQKQAIQNPLIFPIQEEIIEPIPTPEEQGFEKREINNKIVYYKFVNGITIEFIPEEK